MEFREKVIEDAPPVGAGRGRTGSRRPGFRHCREPGGRGYAGWIGDGRPSAAGVTSMLGPHPEKSSNQNYSRLEKVKRELPVSSASESSSEPRRLSAKPHSTRPPPELMRPNRTISLLSAATGN